MSKDRTDQIIKTPTDGTGDIQTSKKLYEAPKILSVEPLEAVAAACEPTGAQFGKDVPLGCIQAQS